MAPKRGTNPRPASRWVNALGFVTFSLAAAALLAAVVLLPAYSDLRNVRHQRELSACRNADLQARYDAGELVIEAAQNDPTFMKRLAISQGEFIPSGQQIIHMPQDSSAVRPDVIAPPPTPRPDAPPRWIRHAAGRVSRPDTRRGLLLMAAGLLVVAGLFFSGRVSDDPPASDVDA
jgi:hypothetical protein